MAPHSSPPEPLHRQLTTDDSAAWNLELTRTGQVRFPILRRRLAVRLGLFAFALVSPAGSVVSAARGERPWGWWEIASVVALPLLLYIAANTVWTACTGRPVLVVDHEAVTLGRKRLTWQEIRSVESPAGSSWQLGPRWLQTEVVTVVPFESRRRRQIVIMSEYAVRVDVLGEWLADLQRRQRHAIGE